MSFTIRNHIHIHVDEVQYHLSLKNYKVIARLLRKLVYARSTYSVVRNQSMTKYIIGVSYRYKDYRHMGRMKKILSKRVSKHQKSK